MKNAAIYTRKSKFTSKGESIQNQIQICKDYLLKSNETYDFIIYEDEGFSGKNTDRPEYKKMLKAAKAKTFDILICYRLDRISRNIADFALLIEQLEKYNINFISVNEHFDTTTPMGRAMMYITSVFAQLERETIAERIKDNMLELSKTGRWLGGRTPTGYESTSVIYYDDNMKERKMFKLTPIKEELDLVKIIFDKYLEYKSLSAVTKYLLANNFKTKFNKNWDYSQVKSILINPSYVRATEDTIKYMGSKNLMVTGTPNGVNGILTYNKRKSKAGPYRKESEWIYAIGQHEGIISSENWIKVQKILDKNNNKAPRLGKTHTALLSGIIRCGKCGSIMKIVYGSKNKEGKRNYYYSCTLKHKSGKTLCDNKNVRGDMLEKQVISELKFLCINKNKLINGLSTQKNNTFQELTFINSKQNKLKQSIVKNNLAIENLLNNLSLTQDKSVSRLILEKIENLKKKNKELEEILQSTININLNKEYESYSFTPLIDALTDFESIMDICTLEEKQKLLASIIETAYWYGDKNELEIKLKGSEN